MPQQKSRDELGAMAGVSGKTYEHAAAVLDNAPEEVIQATRKNELSINAAYKVTKMPQEKQQEDSALISSGESAKKVISEVKRRKKDDMSYWEKLIPHAENTAKDGSNVEAVIVIMNHALEASRGCS